MKNYFLISHVIINWFSKKTKQYNDIIAWLGDFSRINIIIFGLGRNDLEVNNIIGFSASNGFYMPNTDLSPLDRK